MQIVISSLKTSNKFCMSHLEWVYTKNGLCPKCGSAMLEDKDMT